MIRLKLIIRSIFKEPLRTMAIILSLTAGTFVALFCISGIVSAKSTLTNYFSAYYGDVDIMVANRGKSVEIKDEDISSDFKKTDYLYTNIYLAVRNPYYYNYVGKLEVSVLGLDTKEAYNLRVIDGEYPNEGGITITTPLAERLGKKVGDTISFCGRDKKEYEEKILEIVEPKRFIKNFDMCIITNKDLVNKINVKNDNAISVFIDVPEDKIASTISELSEKYPEYSVFGTKSNETDETFESTLSVYYLVFAVVFLMIGFIVYSMSKHILNERMSLIGMLRSIGGSMKQTSMILLAESVFYGLCGGVLGTLLFLPFRGSTTLGIFDVNGSENMKVTDGINIMSVTLVIIAVILLQCLCSFTAILKATKTPVRDIIFKNKETSYIISKNTTVAGIIFLIVGLVIYIVFDNFVSYIITALLSEIGLVLVLPYISILVAKLFSGFAQKKNMPVLKLAVKEAVTKKSSVSSSQLIVSVISLTMAVIMISFSLLSFFLNENYDCNIIISNPSLSGERYDYIENIDGVEGIEKIYCHSIDNDVEENNTALINSNATHLEVFGYDEKFKYFKAISDLPNEIGEDEIVLDKALAKRYKLKQNDQITLTLKTETLRPVTLNLKIKQLCNALGYDNRGITVLINKDVYKSIYKDYPDEILVNVQEDKLYQVQQILQRTRPEENLMIQTYDEYMTEKMTSLESLLALIYAIVFLGLVLSFMGTSSNMIIGFEQSRRKYAVFYSVAMNRKKLRKLIILETAYLSIVSIVVSFIFGVYFLNIIQKALNILNMGFVIDINYGYMILFVIVIFIMLNLTSVKPIRSITKMNMAEEIKTVAD